MVIGSSGDSTDGEDTTSSETSRSQPRDPILYLVDGAKWILGTINSAHEKFENSPRWFRVGFGIVVFLSSIYFGKDIRNATSSLVETFLVPFFGDFVQIQFGIWVVLFLLVLVMIQTSIVNYRLNMLADESSDGQMQTGDVAPDGGQIYSEKSNESNGDSSGAGALSGAATGAVIGASFGPAGVVGGAVLGAIVGDEIEKSSTKSRKKQGIKLDVVRTLVDRGAFPPNSIKKDRLYQLLTVQEENLIEEALTELVSDPSAPVVMHENSIQLTNRSEALTYIRHFGEDSE